MNGSDKPKPDWKYTTCLWVLAAALILSPILDFFGSDVFYPREWQLDTASSVALLILLYLRPRQLGLFLCVFSFSSILSLTGKFFYQERITGFEYGIETVVETLCILLGFGLYRLYPMSTEALMMESALDSNYPPKKLLLAICCLFTLHICCAIVWKFVYIVYVPEFSINMGPLPPYLPYVIDVSLDWQSNYRFLTFVLCIACWSIIMERESRKKAGRLARLLWRGVFGIYLLLLAVLSAGWLAIYFAVSDR